MPKRSNSNLVLMEPKITSDGKFLCETDKKTFDTVEEYNHHISKAHLATNPNSSL